MCTVRNVEMMKMQQYIRIIYKIICGPVWRLSSMCHLFKYNIVTRCDALCCVLLQCKFTIRILPMNMIEFQRHDTDYSFLFFLHSSSLLFIVSHPFGFFKYEYERNKLHCTGCHTCRHGFACIHDPKRIE